MGGKSKYRSCKIPKCHGAPKNGTYTKGFCKTHYNQYRTGRIDENGKPRRVDKSEKHTRQRYNKYVRRTATVDRKVRVLGDDLSKEVKRKDTLFTTEANKPVVENVNEMRKRGQHLRSREFIFQNIENIHNDTLRALLRSKPVAPTFDPIVKGVDPFDLVHIIRHIRRGFSPQRIKKLYSKYSLKKLQEVKAEVKKGSYPLPLLPTSRLP